MVIPVCFSRRLALMISCLTRYDANLMMIGRGCDAGACFVVAVTDDHVVDEADDEEVSVDVDMGSRGFG